MEYHDQFAFCPGCGAPYDASSRRSAPSLFVCPRCQLEVYNNSKPSVSAVIPSLQRPDRVLVIVRATPPSIGALALPGGILDYGEMPESGICREVLEETGVTVHVAGVLHCHLISYQYKSRHIWMYETAFLCDPVDESAPAGRTEEASSTYFESVAITEQSARRFAFPEQVDVVNCYRNRHLGAPHAVHV